MEGKNNKENYRSRVAWTHGFDNCLIPMSAWDCWSQLVWTWRRLGLYMSDKHVNDVVNRGPSLYLTFTFWEMYTFLCMIQRKPPTPSHVSAVGCVLASKECPGQIRPMWQKWEHEFRSPDSTNHQGNMFSRAPRQKTNQYRDLGKAFFCSIPQFPQNRQIRTHSFFFPAWLLTFW